MRVTLVGSGHYARDIVCANYRAIDPQLLRALITPHDTTETLAKTALSGLPVVRSAEAWLKCFGRPTQADIFDLCVHPAEILDILPTLIEHGACRFVLPKPVATSRAALERITDLLSSNQIVAAVASQWHYSHVTDVLAGAVASLGSLPFVYANFSQAFTHEQLKRYTPLTALLPHMVQVLMSTGLWGEDLRPVILRAVKQPTRWEMTIRTSTGRQLELVTDLNAPVTTREVRVIGDCKKSVVTADFLARFEHGGLISSPSVTVAGQRQEVIENNILVMLQRMLAGFRGESELLTLERYLPLAEALLGL